MRDLLFMLLPVAAALYFLIHPQQLSDLLGWLARFAGI
jgi:hypothetical protein